MKKLNRTKRIISAILILTLSLNCTGFVSAIEIDNTESSNETITESSEINEIQPYVEEIFETDSTQSQGETIFTSDTSEHPIKPMNFYTFPYPNIVENNTTYFIRNAQSGKYLSVSGGSASVGTNVLQYRYHGGAAQQWKLVHTGNGLFKLVSGLASSRVLNLVAANNQNGVNINLADDTNHMNKRFGISRAADGTFVIFTQGSDFTKAVAVVGALADDGANVFQWAYENPSHINEQWIFEPVNKNPVRYSVAYAKSAYNKRSKGFPDFSQNCANFVSQAMLAGGIHQRDQWYIHRKNNDYDYVGSDWGRLDHSWETMKLGWPFGSSPWISAPQFQKFWSERTANSEYYGSYILKNPNLVYNSIFSVGDVVQLADNKGKAWHTLIIVGLMIDEKTGIATFTMASNTSDYGNKSFLEVVRGNVSEKFIFYDVT